MDNKFNYMFLSITRKEFFHLLLRVSVASVVTYYTLKYLQNHLDPTNKSKKKARENAAAKLKRLQLDSAQLSEYELVMASQLIIPEEIKVNWSNIAGLDSLIEELRESIVLPIKYRDNFPRSDLCQAPKGVLLHGPPGCGKTLIAKATAKEAVMNFLNLDVAILTDKWYGESQKYVSATFSLARKIEPCVIFIDEIDSFLRSRNTHDHEATAMMKTQFMMLWDGLATESGSTVIVMGATNRPQDLDKAILRRMPSQFHVSMPNVEQRSKVLSLVLQGEKLGEDVDLNRLSELTDGFSGSDLRELCRSASGYRMRKLLRNAENKSKSVGKNELTLHQYPITMDDLKDSFGKMRDSKMHTGMLRTENRIDLD